ncbi:unnamed protein product [Leptosia nina]|uniref:Uncharacterized protein n=1 Tax=Leptosia nina TaxID=320188 RepID=A0AAV1J162_9NEOP
MVPCSVGYYVVEWEKYETCRGPKLKNLTEFTSKLLKNKDDHFIGQLNMTFLEDTRVDEIRMYVYTIKDNAKVLLWNYNINKPCQHYVFATLLESYLGAKNCIVKKGFYYSDMDMSDLMAKYIGKQFFYGEYLFKVLMNSKKGNLFCTYFDPKFKKKKTQKT